jgi:hypothetical protein
MKLRVLVDADPARTSGEAGEELVELFPADGEFARTVSLLVPLLEDGRLPLEAALHLYSHECVERVRALERDGRLDRVRCRLPLWPACLFAAARIRVHAWREIEALLPKEREVAWRPARTAGVLHAARTYLGFGAFDARAYAAALRDLARRDGWEPW